MKITDVAMRALKTFVQAFLAFLVVELIPIFANIASYDFADWRTWLLPIIGGGIAAGLSAIQNNILNKVNKSKEETDDLEK